MGVQRSFKEPGVLLLPPVTRRRIELVVESFYEPESKAMRLQNGRLDHVVYPDGLDL